MKPFRHPSELSRRRVTLGTAGAAILGAAWGRVHAQGHAQGGSQLATPSDMEGPFYPVEPIPLRASLVHRGGLSAKGPQLVLEGVVQRAGAPVAGVKVEIWQCDAQAIYRHPASRPADMDPGFEGYGAQITDAAGRYRFITLMPVAYGGRPPHIHYRLWLGPQVLLTTQSYLAGQTSESGMFSRLRGASTARERQTMALTTPTSGPAQARFDIVLA